jgi:ribosomal protein S18 acetylase RimI-like enzyme
MIRLATTGDAQRIGELWLEMVQYHKQFDAIMFQASGNGAEFYERSILSRLSDPQTRILIAEVEGEVVGYVLGMLVNITPEMFVPIRSGFLADISVTEAFRQQGIGRDLVERLVLWFQSQDVAYFEWHVAEKNKVAVKFWKSIGGETTMLRMRTNI